MLKSKFIKLTAICMMIITTLSISTPAMAATEYMNSTGSVVEDVTSTIKHGEDKNQKEQSKYAQYTSDSSSTTDVYVSQASTFSVTAPVVAILNGQPDTNGNYTGDIKYSVKGNIAADEMINVEPESSFQLIQSGKENVDCSVISKDTTTTKTNFTYADGLRAEKELSQEYTITTKDITAGSWHGSLKTNISLSSGEKYYSSIDKAVNDANNLTTQNADISVSDVNNAEASLFLSDNKSYITLMKDTTSIGDLLMNNDTSLDLHNNTLNFKTGKFITYNDNFHLYNGSIKSVNSKNVVYSKSTNPETSLDVSNVIFDIELNENFSEIHSSIQTTSKNLTAINLKIKQYGDTSTKAVAGVVTYNPDKNSNNENSKCELINCSLDANLPKVADVIRGIQTKHNLKLNNSDISIHSDIGGATGAYCPSGSCSAEILNTNIISHSKNGSTDGFASYSNNVNMSNVNIDCYTSGNNTSYGVNISGGETFSITDSKIKSYTDSKNSFGIRSHASILNKISNCDIYSDVLNANLGAGISAVSGKLISTNNTVYGKQWALETPSSSEISIVEGGVYTSTDHTGYICGRADISNVTFKIANRDKYTVKDVDYGLYVGSRKDVDEYIVNFNNCIIGDSKSSEHSSYNGIVAQGHNNYYAPNQINVNNTKIYTTKHAFVFNVGTEERLIETKFNLYGNTDIYVYDSNENKYNIFTKDELSKEIQSWKSELNDKKSQGYCVGNVIFGNEVAVVDESNMTITKLKITDTANVYDYR